MKLKHWAAATAISAGLALATTAGMAAAISNLGAIKNAGAAQSSLVEKTHGWHRTCMWGLNGWHRHIPGVGRVQCTTHKCWTNSWGIRRCRWF